ncbi:PhzF family phenazine biosynthesis protein [Actinophytocola sp. KF-1]
MIDYLLVDMFTDRPFTGSSLGVVPDADRLDTAAMRAIAAELNATETAFVLTPSSPEATYRVRVFTPSNESPHGGHSAVGTAATLVRLGVIPGGPVVQECGTGRQHLIAEPGRATLTGSGALPGTAVDPEPLLGAVGLTAAETDLYSPMAAGFSARFPFLPVHERALAVARPDHRRLGELGVAALFLFSWRPDSRCARARLFAPGFDIPEDPACAPVALALGIWLAEAGLFPEPDGLHGYHIRQGDEIGRPAVLRCTAEITDGRVARAAVTGSVTAVADGRIAVPA